MCAFYCMIWMEICLIKLSSKQRHNIQCLNNKITHSEDVKITGRKTITYAKDYIE